MGDPLLTMAPAPGSTLLRYAGDRIRVVLTVKGGPTKGWTARLRTNLGRAHALRNELVARRGGGNAFAGASWRDIPMDRSVEGWVLDMPLTEIGWFRAKAYAIDPQGRQHWPEGHDLGIAIQPNGYRTGNTIYCAFVRQFGKHRQAASSVDALRDEQLAILDRHGYTVIPPSGKLRDLIAQLPHVVDRLGCRILHLLPVTPTPTTYARFGRHGSPYAGQDLIAIDPALVEFDRRTTGVDQFRELTYAAHRRGCRIFLDVVLNHTGWGSRIHETHPEWFLRNGDGSFHSPGAWGVTWEDLVELDHRRPELWDLLAEALIEWCRRGVDGFRCDAGYMVPAEAWQYITARVRHTYPDTVFLLEGLGGAWSVTENLLTEGGLQWAYSELFQNLSAKEISSYVDHCLSHQRRLGSLIHYSETHDNDRLAKRGSRWSLLRNRLCALTSSSGCFGFTAGVEWLCQEKIQVHQAPGLNWGAEENLVDDLATLNRLLTNHPCFFDGAQVRRLSPDGAQVLVLARTSDEGLDHLIVAMNVDPDRPGTAQWTIGDDEDLLHPRRDLLSGTEVDVADEQGRCSLTLEPGGAVCLAVGTEPVGLHGDAYRQQRSLALGAYQILARVLEHEQLGPIDWRELAAFGNEDPARFITAATRIDPELARRDLAKAIRDALAADGPPVVVEWQVADVRRVVMVPPGHWLLIKLDGPFHARLDYGDARPHRLRQAVETSSGWTAAFAPHEACDAALVIDAFNRPGTEMTGPVRFLAAVPEPVPRNPERGLFLATNGRGAMMRMAVDLGAVTSKYDCVLGANLHSSVPVDRHVLVKRMRAWVVADGFISPLANQGLAGFQAGPPGYWKFIANAGDGRTVEIHLMADLVPDRNLAILRFSRPDAPPLWGTDLNSRQAVSVVVRFDLEDRGFHSETTRTAGADLRFTQACQPLAEDIGFRFAPAPDRILEAQADAGEYHHEPEWSLGIPHPVEGERGMATSGDAWSPGWFRFDLAKGGAVTLQVGMDGEVGDPESVEAGILERLEACRESTARSGLSETDRFGRSLATAVQAFIVDRDQERSVIAGYPWFLDWGRDTLICARGMLAIGLDDDVVRLLRVFGAFEERGTLPNCIRGEDASNRDTSDAPLWYGLVCEEAAERLGRRLYAERCGNRTIREVLAAIAKGYLEGTPNGIRVDPDSGLVWSPSHFTWMDTNYPAGTPRQGYPVEIQVLWIRLLRQLDRLGVSPQGEAWSQIATRATTSLRRLFWLTSEGWLADVLIAPAGVPAMQAVADHALRSNCLLAVSLGILTGQEAKTTVAAAATHLLVPGALRSLAPLPAHPPLAIRDDAGQLLNDPHLPYWGTYAGDEDRRRKPAYHNGTAWGWTFPGFCEALALAWDWHPVAVATARAYLGSCDRLLGEGCLGQLPEICDGDAPHRQRGCDAQAWSVTEAARVWKRLTTSP